MLQASARPRISAGAIERRVSREHPRLGRIDPAEEMQRRLPVCSAPVTEEDRGTGAYFDKAILNVQHVSDMLQKKKVAAFNTTLSGRGAPTAFQKTGQSNPLIALET
jgi:hypothetical protein